MILEPALLRFVKIISRPDSGVDLTSNRLILLKFRSESFPSCKKSKCWACRAQGWGAPTPSILFLSLRLTVGQTDQRTAGELHIPSHILQHECPLTKYGDEAWNNPNGVYVAWAMHSINTYFCAAKEFSASVRWTVQLPSLLLRPIFLLLGYFWTTGPGLVGHHHHAMRTVLSNTTLQ